MATFLVVLSVKAAPEYTGNVSGFYVNNTGTALVNLDVETPNCGNAGWPFTFSVDAPGAKEWVSMFLMARAQQSVIRVGHSANPDGHCSIVYVHFYDF